jgi:hypothetical protein
VGAWGRSAWSAPLQVTTGTYSGALADKLVLLGGNTSASHTDVSVPASPVVELLAPSAGLHGAWDPLPKLPIALLGAAAALLRDRVVVTGGLANANANANAHHTLPSLTTAATPLAAPRADCWVLDLAAHTWHPLARMRFARRWHAAVVHGGSLLVTGGVDDKGRLCSVERYDAAQAATTATCASPP